LCTPAIPTRSPALVQTESLAYLTLRRLDYDGTARWELGATGHGPTGPDLADRICQQTRAWDRDRAAAPIVTAHPTGTPTTDASRVQTIHKPHTVLTVVF